MNAYMELSAVKNYLECHPIFGFSFLDCNISLINGIEFVSIDSIRKQMTQSEFNHMQAHVNTFIPDYRSEIFPDHLPWEPGDFAIAQPVKPTQPCL